MPERRQAQDHSAPQQNAQICSCMRRNNGGGSRSMDKDNKPQTETTDNSMATLPANDTPAHHSVSDEMADYSMLDNEDIYSLLASN